MENCYSSSYQLVWHGIVLHSQLFNLKNDFGDVSNGRIKLSV